MAEEKTEVPDVGNWFCWLIVAFVVAIVLGLGIIALGYRQSHAGDNVCAHAEARCDSP
jgi:hypothetical protein